MLFVIVLVFISTELICGTAIPTYERLDPLSGRALTCDRCPAGYHMSAHCTDTSPTVCNACPGNHYTGFWNYLPRCLYCNTFCVDNQFVKEDCSPTRDRVCECNDGYFWYSDICIKHKACPGGYRVKSRGTTHSDTECERCPTGSFSSGPSLRAECLNHTDCSSLGLHTVLGGRSWHDNICATCGNLTDEDASNILRAFLPAFLSRAIPPRKINRLMRRNVLRHTQHRDARQPHAVSIREWVREAPGEDIRRLPEMLRMLSLKRAAGRLERTIRTVVQHCNSD